MASPASLQSLLMIYLFPLQFSVGVIGNSVNLVILLNKRMRTKTNVLLSILALADTFFLIFMLPHSLIYHPSLMKHHEVRVFFVYASHHLAGVTNLCSFISAWIIVLVTIERASAVLWPLKARLFWTHRTLRRFVICILVASVLTSMHLHISHQVKVVVRNETVINATTGIVEVAERSIIKPMIRTNWQTYWRLATLLDTFFLVIVPVVIVTVSTAIIVSTLHKRRPGSIFLEKEPTHDVQSEALNSPLKHSAMSNSARSQRRATFIVVVIAGTFSLCQLPSAVTHVLQIMVPEIAERSEFRSATTLSNSLVVSTKAMNFFLFCMWSSNFRRNLVRILTAKLESFKGSWWLTEPKEELKSKSRFNYSEPNVPTKHSFPCLIRPPFLQICHSLPAKIDSDECTEVERSEEDELLN